MRDYELVVLLHPDLEINLDKPLKKVKDVVTSSGGKVINQDVWGKRKLAYPIRKENFAVYVYFDIQLPPEAVSKVEGLLNITNEVIRHLVTNPVPVFEEESSDDDEEGKDKDEKKDKEEKSDKKEVKEEKEEKEEKPKETKSSKTKDDESKEKEG